MVKLQLTVWASLQPPYPFGQLVAERRNVADEVVNTSHTGTPQMQSRDNPRPYYPSAALDRSFVQIIILIQLA